MQISISMCTTNGKATAAGRWGCIPCCVVALPPAPKSHFAKKAKLSIIPTQAYAVLYKYGETIAEGSYCIVVHFALCS